ncbi:MAG: S8 family serine peptidase [Armatimonadetes bacterium]|nr:S8 family serine peptidase [Armatimonadota bacterium]
MLNLTPSRLTAYVSARSQGGISVFSGQAVIKPETVQAFLSRPKDTHIATGKLQEFGFEVERVGPLSVRISGPAELFTRRFGVKVEQRRDAALEAEGVTLPLTPTLETSANLLDTGIPEVEGIVFPQPVQLHAPSPKAPSADPPTPGYHHLKVPQDIVTGLNAGPIHQQGIQGQNVRAAMIDSGFQWSHPYFTSRNYNLKVSLPLDSDRDSNGHGTGESANFLAIAPQARLHGLAMTDIIEAFQVARDDLHVQIISNSWGSRYDTDGPNGTWDPYWSLVQAEIALCVQQDIIVLFSGGNGGMSFTASMPETISVGGVYVGETGQRSASDYASSFDSTRFPGQHVPEVCGLVGLRPRAIYITLPIPPGSEIDRSLGGKSFPNKDETATRDGWAVFSGTSAACPMVAGVVALILSRFPGADLQEVRQRLYRAVDVTQGQSAMGDVAGPGFDAATGHGLVDTEQACA